MSKKIVYSGQSFLDKVLECTGDIDNAFEMALFNGISVSDEIPVGIELQISAITKKSIEAFFNEYNRPATAIVEIIENNDVNYKFPQGEFPISF